MPSQPNNNLLHQRQLEEIHRAYLDFKQKLDALSHREDELLRELQKRLDLSKIDDLLHAMRKGKS